VRGMQEDIEQVHILQGVDAGLVEHRTDERGGVRFRTVIAPVQHVLLAATAASLLFSLS